MREGGTFIAALVLCAVAHRDGASALRGEAPGFCQTNQEGMSCLLHRKMPGPITLKLNAGRKLQLTLQHLLGEPTCNWSHGGDLVHTPMGNDSLIIPVLSEGDSGEYTLRCETGNGTEPSLAVSLLVTPAQGRPTKPQMNLIGRGPGYAPDFQCVSEGSPPPSMVWFNNLDMNGNLDKRQKLRQKDQKANGTTISTVESGLYAKTAVVCCARNEKGEECSQLFDYDLDRSPSVEDEAPGVPLSPGQTLLLRCRSSKDRVRWTIHKEMKECSPEGKELVCQKENSYHGSRMHYLFFKSVNVNDSGVYTCANNKDNNRTKSVHVRVLEEEYIKVWLKEESTVSGQKRQTFCLQANVSSHPRLHSCAWVGPDGQWRETQCPKPQRLWNDRTLLKLCSDLDPGEYQLHVEAGGQRQTKTVSLCVTDTPTVRLREDAENITCETSSSLPMAFTWRTCPLLNDSCQSESAAWREISAASEPRYSDSGQFCVSVGLSALTRAGAEGHSVKCCVKNSVGSQCSEPIFTSVDLLVPPASQHSTPSVFSSHILTVCILVLFLALVAVTLALMYFIRKKKPKYQSQMQMIQMAGPNDNDYIYINFKDFQYDQTWEFPRENLELGKELGSGAFGMVVQATAYGISEPGVSLQVAVKMLKEKHQVVEKEALMSELKMLTHIGHHANIVNLLGACTGSGPTYLIFQYCCYGDLRNYMTTNRELYHKSLTEAFTSELQKPVDNYVPMKPISTRGQESIGLLDGIPGNSEELQEEEEEQALTYNVLLSFACQVAKGMDFLSSKNCIHRDLAARNVLVTHGRLVKIGDFGLARDIDNDSNYVVRGNVRLPVKWMAPESIFQGMYTMKSDVWAYGILLWEIFSLGVTPYPGVKVNNSFYAMIKMGFKMERPYYASDSVYRMMCSCWSLESHERPTFSKLVALIDDQVADMKEKLYHNVPGQDAHDSPYQNATVNLDLSLLAKEEGGGPQAQSQNEYCETHCVGQATSPLSVPDAMEDQPLPGCHADPE